MEGMNQVVWLKSKTKEEKQQTIRTQENRQVPNGKVKCNQDQGNRLINMQRQVFSKYYLVSRIIIPFLSNFCSKLISVLLYLSSTYQFQASQPKCIFQWSWNMTGSINLNHTYLTTNLSTFRRGCFGLETKTFHGINFINRV